jgi:hypothetical protein
MPADPIHPTSSTARRSSAPICWPIWTACRSVSLTNCSVSCPVAARSRWGIDVSYLLDNVLATEPFMECAAHDGEARACLPADGSP